MLLSVAWELGVVGYLGRRGRSDVDLYVTSCSTTNYTFYFSLFGELGYTCEIALKSYFVRAIERA